MWTRNLVIGAIISVVSVLLACGGSNLTKTVGFGLVHGEIDLYQKTGTTPLALGAKSRCGSPPTVRLLNAERSRDDRELWLSNYIIPVEFMKYVVTYIKDAYKKSGVKADDKSLKVLQVSLEKIETKLGYVFFGGDGARVKLRLTIPELKYTRVYEGQHWVPPYGFGTYVINLAVHKAVWKIVRDPVVIKYILCLK